MLKLLVTFVVELEAEDLTELVMASGTYIQEMKDRLNESGSVIDTSTNIRELYTLTPVGEEAQKSAPARSVTPRRRA